MNISLIESANENKKTLTYLRDFSWKAVCGRPGELYEQAKFVLLIVRCKYLPALREQLPLTPACILSPRKSRNAPKINRGIARLLECDLNVQELSRHVVRRTNRRQLGRRSELLHLERILEYYRFTRE